MTMTRSANPVGIIMVSKFKVVAISDTHGMVSYKELLAGLTADLLCIAGDVLYQGHVGEYGRFLKDVESVRDQFRFVALTPGNHDFYIEDNEFMVKGDLKHHYGGDLLVDQRVVYPRQETEEVGPPSSVGDAKDPRFVYVYGDPWIPQIGRTNRWAYEIPRGTKEMLDKRKQIPGGLDILISHSPPYGIMDQSVKPFNNLSDSYGCWDLKDRILSMEDPPHIVLSGHIHTKSGHSKGHSNKEGIDFYNCSVLDEDYLEAYPPQVFEV